MSDIDRYHDLLAQIAAIYDAEGREAATATARALVTTQQPGPIDRQPPCAFDAEIRACLESSPLPVAQAVLAAQDMIVWGVNPVAGRMTDHAASIVAVATLMDPDGPIPSPDFRLGLLFMAGDCYYPLHNHDADETYVIIAGAALWTAGDDTRDRSAGELIHHPGLMPHAFRTKPQGMVALWRWSADINAHSYTFLPDPLEQIA